MKKSLLVMVFLFSVPLYAQQEDIFDDASAFGLDLKQEAEDEIFFYESRFVDIGLTLGGRTFTQGLGQLFGTGVSTGGFLTYYFTRQMAGEFSVNASFHEFLIDGINGHSTLIDVIGRLKYYFITEKFSKGLAFANPYIFFGAGQFFRRKSRDDLPVESTDEGPGIEFGAGFEIPLKERQIFLGFKPSFQLIFFSDEGNRTNRGTRLNGDAINWVVSLTYTF